MIVLRNTLLGILLITISIVSSKKSLKKNVAETDQSSQCPDLKECPYNADPCEIDEDCEPTSLCCKSPCGNICTKQLFTGCQTLRQAASRRAKSLGVDAKSLRMPRCTKAGAFEPVQCDNEIVSSCWCVDETGFELPGTRAPAAALVNCTAPKPCAAHTCRMFCPYGFAVKNDGCPLCKCRDPCEDIRCPDSTACHLENLACADPPCPPVPTCKRGRSLDNICPVGDPLRISDTVRPFLCGTDLSKPQCPPMYQCLVQPGNDYGVCCPASLKIQKAGSCPAPNEASEHPQECGSLCTHDLECPSVQKCCNTDQCGSSCIHPKNVTECIHQRALSEILAVSERAGRGYVPQCSTDGQFEPKQCSRNGLVCWCVDRLGRKMKGSMSAAENVNCSVVDSRSQSLGRSININGKQCEALECAAICEYGFKLDEDGCPTCKCDDPCDGYACPEDEECVTVREPSCTDFLCPTLPVCRPKTIYTNPCLDGTPLTDDITGSPLTCALRSEDEGLCPETYQCTAVAGSTQAVCCPLPKVEVKGEETGADDLMRPQTMCEYLRNFSENMEGTRDGMTLALPPPLCDSEGNYRPEQCHDGECWCVDHFGTEIPKTRGFVNSTKNCQELRESLECLDLTCRMGCDYGFVISEETGCPSCQCRDPCSSITCGNNEECQLVEVSCKDHYCPPVPACLPRKIGQCPYLVATSSSCDFECNSDLICNGTSRCCPNGCGTQCVEPLMYTSCQHQRTIALYQARDSGIRIGKVFIPTCKEDGSFENKQCDPSAKQCWCVDFRGFEVSQTRSPLDKPLNCDSPQVSQSCPIYNCINDCEHGFKIDTNGCRACECVDPCQKIKCREDGESCRLVNVECVDWPCPSVPMCLPRRENPCQFGDPLKLGNSEEFVTCGPDFESCPSSHKCQLSPVGEYAVCCPKPREVCFEPVDLGSCSQRNEDKPLDEIEERNSTRYFFNPKSNRCEKFAFSGCLGNYNNFHSEEMCNRVCPVLSQCERLREKNQRAAEKYNKSTFIPRCEPSTGNWEAVQCLEQVGVCWCVNPQGEPLKGTIVRGAQPECNFRQARNRARDRSDVYNDADLVLEELMMQFSVNDEEEEDDQKGESDASMNWELPIRSRCEALGSQCDGDGKFLPAQCEQEVCWCVDEAGNQLPNTDAFKKGERLCLPTPIEKVEVTLGVRGEYDDISAVPVQNQIAKIIKNLKGVIDLDGIKIDSTSEGLYLSFSLIGVNKVDVAYRLEQMVMQERLPGMTADITKSSFAHKLSKTEPLDVERVIALEHREIVSQSPVSVVAPYHTALIVIAAASAFVISVLTVLVILYKRKMNSMNNAANKLPETDERFMYNRPIYIELPNEKSETIRPDIKPTT